MPNKKLSKQYALIRKGETVPIIITDYKTIKMLYDTSAKAQKRILKIEEVLD